MLACALLAATLMGQDSKPPEVKMGMGQLVFLVDPRDRSMPRVGNGKTSKRHEAHLAFLQKLWEERKALVVGPLAGAGERIGIVLLDVEKSEEAEKIMAEDPLVRVGDLKVETHGWYFAKNYVHKAPGGFMDLQKFWFATLERPDGLPKIDEADGKKLMEGHMANINKMAQDGLLVIAGPIAGTGKFRGVFVFTEPDKDKIIAAADADPLIKSGRLKMSLYEWHTAKGSFGQPK